MNTQLWAILLCLLLIINATLQIERTSRRTIIPDEILQCYHNKTLRDRTNWPPMTMATFVSIIEKVQTDGRFPADMRILVTSLLHRFRLDGIVRDKNIQETETVIPYEVAGFQYDKFRILMEKLIPGREEQFPAELLTTEEQCILHFMLSASIEEWVGLRKEDIPSCKYVSMTKEEAESYGTAGFPITNMWETGRVRAESCPVEDGVVYTRWGTVALGTLLAGIAAGLQPQQVTVDQIIGERVSGGSRKVDASWAATISGDLAEVALLQAVRTKYNLFIARDGHWNDTSYPQWYFLIPDARHEMTKAEFLGGIDGLLIANQIGGWREKNGELRLSQLLDMYYSERGVWLDIYYPEGQPNFERTYKASRRYEKFQKFLDKNRLLQETTAFSLLLYREFTSAPVIEEDAIFNLSARAVETFANITAVKKNFHARSETWDSPPQIDLHLVIDGTWPRTLIMELVSYLCDEVDISTHGSSMGIINGQDGNTVITNTHNPSYLLKKFRTSFNWTAELDFPRVFETLRHKFESRQEGKTWLRPTIYLFLVYDAIFGNHDRQLVKKQVDYFRSHIPELKFIYFTCGSREVFEGLVDDDRRDIFWLIRGKNLQRTARQLVNRLKYIPANIVNPRCAATQNADNYNGTGNIEFYVTPGQTTYLRLHPRYFFSSTNVKFKFKPSVMGSVKTCFSRNFHNSSVATFLDDVECHSFAGENGLEYSVSSPCDGKGYVSQCKPIFILTNASHNAILCTDLKCRYPDQVQVLLTLEGLTCDGCGDRLGRHVLALNVALIIVGWFFYM